MEAESKVSLQWPTAAAIPMENRCCSCELTVEAGSKIAELDEKTVQVRVHGRILLWSKPSILGCEQIGGTRL